MKSLVIAPHPDDETLGCGGTLLRRKAEGGTIGWLLMTELNENWGWTDQQISKRAYEIDQVRKFLGISKEHLYQLGFPTTRLDTIPMADLVASISDVFKSFEPEELFLPHPGDIHSDHRITFDAASACSKWFRYPSLKRIFAYETLSETDFSLVSSEAFRPNIFINIGPYFTDKLKLLDIYSSELGEFPFPRSHESITALAKLRSASSGFKQSEAFELLRERL
ncbi:PIG-L family deacetylase [Synechococcus sp. UW140]|uniref:PIG-L deacetylase family protein n=1 Tax=Synechococcus sp. UW140 TaxID=368503 RepID=UPI0031379DDF